MEVTYRRADGSFVAMVKGRPYHVTAGDPLFAETQRDGAGAPMEPAASQLTPEELRTSMRLSRAQLLIGLVSERWITEAEGTAWLIGTLPASVEALIATLPAEQRFIARARAVSPSVVLRLDPLAAKLAMAQGKTDADLDAFFLTYAQV